MGPGGYDDPDGLAGGVIPQLWAGLLPPLDRMHRTHSQLAQVSNYYPNNLTISQLALCEKIVYEICNDRLNQTTAG